MSAERRLKEVVERLWRLGVPLDRLARAASLSKHVRVVSLRTVKGVVRGATVLVPSQRLVVKSGRVVDAAAQLVLNTYLAGESTVIMGVGGRWLPRWEAVHKVEVGVYSGYCTCPDAVFRGNRLCVHVLAALIRLVVEGLLDLDELKWVEEEAREYYARRGGPGEAGGSQREEAHA